MSEHRKVTQFDKSKWKSAALLGLIDHVLRMVQPVTSLASAVMVLYCHQSSSLGPRYAQSYVSLGVWEGWKVPFETPINKSYLHNYPYSNGIENLAFYARMIDLYHFYNSVDLFYELKQ